MVLPALVSASKSGTISVNRTMATLSLATLSFWALQRSLAWNLADLLCTCSRGAGTRSVYYIDSLKREGSRGSVKPSRRVPNSPFAMNNSTIRQVYSHALHSYKKCCIDQISEELLQHFRSGSG